MEISVGDTSAPYISCRWLWISRTVMPRAYSDRIFSSKPAQRVWCLVHDLRLEAAVAVSGNFYGQLAKVAFEGLLLAVA
jgi:hypothetical protein